MERSLNNDPTPSGTGQRGLSVTEQVQLANLELQFGRFQKDRADAAVIFLKFQADIVEKKLERPLQKAAVMEDFTMVDHLEAELDKLINAIAATRDHATGTGVKRCIQLISGTDKKENALETNVPQNKTGWLMQQASG